MAIAILRRFYILLNLTINTIGHYKQHNRSNNNQTCDRLNCRRKRRGRNEGKETGEILFDLLLSFKSKRPIKHGTLLIIKSSGTEARLQQARLRRSTCQGFRAWIIKF